MITIGEGDVLGEIRAPIYRRVFIAGAQLLTGGLLIYLAFNSETSGAVLKAVLVCLGLGCVVLSQSLFRATSKSLILTVDDLRDSDGRLLCRMSDIVKVERGAFAFKPSNGLLIVTQEPVERAWQPGLWWRFGHKIGIGGATSKGQAKFFGDLIHLHQTEKKREAEEIQRQT